MAESASSERRQQRGRARERRRSLASEPFERADEAARNEAPQEGGARGADTLKQVAATAVAGAVAAGIAGAAKAIRDRGGDESGETAPRGESGSQPSEKSDDQSVDPHAESLEDDSGSGGESDGEGDGGDGDGRNEPEPEPHAKGEPDEERDTQQRDNQPRAESRPVRGASDGDAKEIVDKARDELQQLLGVEPEGVSGFERSNGRWTVMLEVVEVKRIPESTDVLSSYEVAFDDDRRLVSVSQRRRYRRSQVEEGR